MAIIIVLICVVFVPAVAFLLLRDAIHWLERSWRRRKEERRTYWRQWDANMEKLEELKSTLESWVIWCAGHKPELAGDVLEVLLNYDFIELQVERRDRRWLDESVSSVLESFDFIHLALNRAVLEERLLGQTWMQPCGRA